MGSILLAAVDPPDRKVIKKCPTNKRGFRLPFPRRCGPELPPSIQPWRSFLEPIKTIRTLALYVQQSWLCIRIHPHTLLPGSRPRLLDQSYPTALAIVSDCLVPFPIAQYLFLVALIVMSVCSYTTFPTALCLFRLRWHSFLIAQQRFPIAQYLFIA